MLWALLPLKDFVNAKQRLSGVLAPHERRRLFHAMVEDVLDVLATHPAIAKTVIVSDDPSAELLAEHYGVECWPETPLKARGLNAVVTSAAEKIERCEVESLLIIHGDLPLLATGELQQLVDRHQQAVAPAVTIAPDRHLQGSNCMICQPPCVIGFHYGEGSFQKHSAAAAKSGATLNSLSLPGIGCDVDNSVDLTLLLTTLPAEKRSAVYLRESGIADRIAAMDVGNDDKSDRDTLYEC